MAKANNKYTNMLKIAHGEDESGADAVAVKERGRPLKGKRSDPAYESTTILMLASIKEEVARIYPGRKRPDLSSVVEEAMLDWIKKMGR
jgi:hypothetical protein